MRHFLSASLLGFLLATPVLSQGTSAFTTFDATGAGTGTLQGTVATTIDAAGDIAGIYIDSTNNEHAFLRTASGVISTVSPTGAGSSSNSIVIPLGFDTAGDLAGIFSDANSAMHGFVRAAGGAITIINVPGAGTGQDQGTYPDSIDGAGDIAGSYVDANSLPHGFLRAANGSITTFDPPGATKGDSALAVNDSGVVTGDYLDANNVVHAFVRAAGGTITTFEAPNSGTALGEGTAALTIDAAGDVGGVYSDANNVMHGFIRSASGLITSFDAPGAGAGSYQGTYPVRFDAAGDLAGMYTDTNDVVYSFVRSASGTISTYSAPGASPSSTARPASHSRRKSLAAHPIRTGNLLMRSRRLGSFFNRYRGFPGKIGLISKATSGVLNGTGGHYYGTIGVGINAIGETAGVFTVGDYVAHGFVRTASGSLTAFDAPGAGTSVYEGTGGLSINASGTIAGGYADSNSTIHAFFVTLGQAVTTTTLESAPNPSVFGESVTLTATVSADGQSVPDGESVFFLNGTAQLESATLTGGTATLATTALPVGTDSITASYGGDSNLAGSTSTAVNQIVAQASTTTQLTSTPNPSIVAQLVTLTATVSGQFGGTATGTVTFYNGTTSLGTGTLSGNSASLNTAAIPQGTQSITAVYGGDGNYTGSTSAAVSQVVNAGPPAPDFTLAAAPASITVNSGQSGNITVTVTPANGFNSAVSFSCSGLPSGASCSFSPQTVTPPGTTSTTLTVGVSGTSAQLRHNERTLFPASALAAILCCFGLRKQRRLRMLFLVAVSVIGLSLFTACSSKTSVQPVTSTVTITGTSGALQPTTTFSLTVN
jgi:hypothetical protein